MIHFHHHYHIKGNSIPLIKIKINKSNKNHLITIKTNNEQIQLHNSPFQQNTYIYIYIIY